MNKIKIIKGFISFFGNFRISIFFLYLSLILLAVFCYIPFYLMLINATRSTAQISQGLSFIPGTSTVFNYIELFKTVNMWRGFLNSLFVAVPATVLSAYFSALTAYGFSKFRFKGNTILFWLLLGSMMVPVQLGLVGYYQLVVKIHLVNTLWALIIPSISSGITVFFLKMYIDSNVSDSLLEAARIDGSSEFRTFHGIVFPIIMPGVAMFSILNFVSSWNSYFMPVAILNSLDKFTLPVLIPLVKGMHEQNLGAMYLAIAITVIPVMIVFLFLSRYIIAGVTAGALKE